MDDDSYFNPDNTRTAEQMANYLLDFSLELGVVDGDYFWDDDGDERWKEIIRERLDLDVLRELAAAYLEKIGKPRAVEKM